MPTKTKTLRPCLTARRSFRNGVAAGSNSICRPKKHLTAECLYPLRREWDSAGSIGRTKVRIDCGMTGR